MNSQGLGTVASQRPHELRAPRVSFIENIFSRLNAAHDQPVLREARAGEMLSANGGEFLALVARARAFATQVGVKKGERCALLAHNSIRWAALDLALMAEGIIVVPLYHRQAPAELIAMMRDCRPSLIFCGDAGLEEGIAQAWTDSPPRILFDDVFAARAEAAGGPELLVVLAESDPITIIYTSGTSGEAKGVILTVGNLNHMLACTNERLDLLMGPTEEPDRVFHYLPFCFAGSWILLLTCLGRNSTLTLSTDLARLAEDIRTAVPHYFLNVPTLLERVRSGVEEKLNKSGVARRLFANARAAWLRRQAGHAGGLDAIWLALGDRLIFAAVRKRLGGHLKALICGSAPLARETQLFFLMMGIPVLQVYGLTETTAICTMDDPRHIEPGYVGPAIPGIEMKLAPNNEILMRGPNVFLGYWNRPDETAKVLRDGWFHTGDQGELNDVGNWRIIGRLKNLIILRSGHNIAPEPLEEALLQSLPSAQQVVLVGNNRSYLTALVTGTVSREHAETALAALNQHLPHYKRIGACVVLPEPFTIENGLLTANGKVKRDSIATRFAAEIEELYHRKEA